ncbi:hypothetical protein GBAR_LOCUS28178 [Geodia barretti]|uniref:Uncharacterized protein n=1 Tax=Geodia barretti TaxID=519541 RepID=A0AA35XAF3_GEOBA|nr:hypothetical protein GBAR_LOCUS28178 [Geodia barretti]
MFCHTQSPYLMVAMAFCLFLKSSSKCSERGGKEPRLTQGVGMLEI